MPKPWRVGRKQGGNVYRQIGPEPSDDDPQIGMFCTTADAIDAVQAVNFMIEWGKRARQQERLNEQTEDLHP